MSDLVLGLGIVAIVLTLAALFSGIVERAPLSFPIIFLGLGFLFGGGGLKIIEIDVRSPELELVATISLALALFLDAVNVQLDELRQDWYVPMLSLGPGTLLTVAGMSLAAYVLLDTSLIMSLLLGTILSSTDAVVLRDVVRDARIPRSVRRALSVEAGMNDIVILPIVLVLIAILTSQAGSLADWAALLAKILILSPLVGLAVGGIGANLMGRVDARFGIRREYQALYGIGLVLAAFSAGQAFNGNGFLAAFFAGLAVTLFNVSLCDCFLEYGEVTAEMMMLLAFVLFGAVLSTLLRTINLLPALGLAAIALIAVRPAAMGLVLRRASMSNAARAFIGWFGPRGLTSLLLALLVIQAGAEDGEWILAVVGTVVVVSVIAHGTSATPVSTWYGRHVARSRRTLAEERESTFVGLFEPDAAETDRISPQRLAELLRGDDPPLVLDVRARAHYQRDDGQIPGSVRVPPDQIEEWASGYDRERFIVAYCT